MKRSIDRKCTDLQQRVKCYVFMERITSLTIRFIVESETNLAVSQPGAEIESFRKQAQCAGYARGV